MKLQFLIFVEILLFLVVIVKTEGENECKEDQFCVRLCCNGPKSDCFDLNLLPKEKKLPENYKILYGEPDDVFGYDFDPWNFTIVSRYFCRSLED